MSYNVSRLREDKIGACEDWDHHIAAICVAIYMYGTFKFIHSVY